MTGALVPAGASVPAILSERSERVRYGSREARDRAIVELAVRGMRPAEIEARIVVSRETIYAVLTRARRKGEAVPFFSTSGVPRGRRAVDYRNVPVRASVLSLLEHDADIRGLTTIALAARVLETAIEEGLIDAILDEGGGS